MIGNAIIEASGNIGSQIASALNTVASQIRLHLKFSRTKIYRAGHRKNEILHLQGQLISRLPFIVECRQAEKSTAHDETKGESPREMDHRDYGGRYFILFGKEIAFVQANLRQEHRRKAGEI